MLPGHSVVVQAVYSRIRINSRSAAQAPKEKRALALWNGTTVRIFGTEDPSHERADTCLPGLSFCKWTQTTCALERHSGIKSTATTAGTPTQVAAYPTPRKSMLATFRKGMNGNSLGNSEDKAVPRALTFRSGDRPSRSEVVVEATILSRKTCEMGYILATIRLRRGVSEGKPEPGQRCALRTTSFPDGPRFSCYRRHKQSNWLCVVCPKLGEVL